MKRTRRMKGGFWESLTSAWEKTKQSATNAYGSVSGSNTTATTTPPPAYGGKKKRTSRRIMRGGNIEDNISLTNLASRAAPFTGNTAQPHNLVGGKTRRRRRHSRKHRRSHRKY